MLLSPHLPESGCNLEWQTNSCKNQRVSPGACISKQVSPSIKNNTMFKISSTYGKDL